MDIRVPKDWQSVLSFIKLKYPEAVLAGGALRDLLTERQPKDLDIFIEARDFLADEVKQELLGLFPHRNPRARIVINTAFADYCEALDGVAFAIELEMDGVLPVQVIALDKPVDPFAVVERIDLGLCRVSYDGHRIYEHPDFLHDLRNQCFTIRRCGNAAQRKRSIERFTRLQAKFPAWPLAIQDGVSLDFA